MGVWDFIQDQVLGMRWLNKLIGMGLSALGLDVNGRIGDSVQFFIYDILKITILLLLVYPAVHWIYKCRASAWRNVFIFDLIAHGGFGKSCITR